jgi:hypothetical protein
MYKSLQISLDGWMMLFIANAEENIQWIGDISDPDLAPHLDAPFMITYLRWAESPTGTL